MSNVFTEDSGLVHYVERPHPLRPMRLFCRWDTVVPEADNGPNFVRWDPQSRVTCLFCLMQISSAAR